MSSDAKAKKIEELRVVDLRVELEKRGLDKTGIKAVLIDRLRKVRKEKQQNGGGGGGHDVEFFFIIKATVYSLIIVVRDVFKLYLKQMR